MNNHPLAGTGGKPLISVPSSNTTYVGRIIIELVENAQTASNGSAATDANGLVLVISPALDSTVSRVELLRRIAAALPFRIKREIQLEERRRNIAEENEGIY